MSKKHWDGVYKTVGDIPPEHLLNFYLMGDQRERTEAKIEILRRLYVYQRIVSNQDTCATCGEPVVRVNGYLFHVEFDSSHVPTQEPEAE